MKNRDDMEWKDIDFIDYLYVNTWAKIGIACILALWFIDPDRWGSGTYDFIRLCVFIYCAYYAFELFLSRVKDTIVPIAYVLIAIYIQPFHKFYGYMVKRGKTEYLELGSYDISIWIGVALLVLLGATFYERKYRSKWLDEKDDDE